MPEDAVMDAVDIAPDAELESTATDTEQPDTEQPDQPSEPADRGAAPVDAKAPVALVENGKPTEAFKQALEKLRSENPEMAAKVRHAVFKSEEMARELPGGLKELRQLRETVETLGGDVGIQEVQSELRGWHEFDEQFSNGDPKAIEFMLSDPQGQQSFLKLMPTALAKFSELHPDGYGQYMASVFVGDMAQNGITLALDRLQDFIADNPKAMDQWNKLAGYVNRLGQLSQKKVEPPKSEAQQQKGASDIEQREAQLTRTEWKNETANEQRQVFQSEWARNAAGRKITEAQSAAIKELFESRLNKAIQAKHASVLERYFNAKDKNGFMRYASSISKTEVPRALKAAFDAVMPGRPGPKPGTANGVKPPVNGALKVTPGFTQIAKQPATQDIDYRHQFNTPANFQAGKAILKDGRKVTWAK